LRRRDGELRLHLEAASIGGPDRKSAADHDRALAHAEKPVPVRLPVARARAVVADSQSQRRTSYAISTSTVAPGA
jgi:hypothetical protein